MKDLPVVLVAAMNKLGFIGNEDGDLIHKNARDLKRFQDLSTNGVLIMGRKTYESLPKALPNRSCVVISQKARRDTLKHPPGTKASDVLLIGNIDNAIEAAHKVAEIRGHDKIVIAGGTSVYAHFLTQAEELYLTEFDQQEFGGAKFPVEALDQMIADGRFVQADEYQFYDGEMLVSFRNYRLAPCIERVAGDFVHLRNGVRFRVSSLRSYMEYSDHVLIAQDGFGFQVMADEMNLGLLMKELDALTARENVTDCAGEAVAVPNLKLVNHED